MTYFEYGIRITCNYYNKGIYICVVYNFHPYILWLVGCNLNFSRAQNAYSNIIILEFSAPNICLVSIDNPITLFLVILTAGWDGESGDGFSTYDYSKSYPLYHLYTYICIEPQILPQHSVAELLQFFAAFTIWNVHFQHGISSVKPLIYD